MNLKNQKQIELEETFKRACKDPEMIDMAEEGLADYLNQILNMEK